MKIIKTLLDYPPARNNLTGSLTLTILLYATSNIFWSLDKTMQHMFYGISQNVFSGKEYWRIFSAILIHSDLGHYASNAVAIFALGYLLLGWFSWRVFPLYCFLLSGLVNAIALKTYEPQTRLLGASGMVYLMAGFWLMSYILIQRSKTMSRRIIRAMGVTLGTLFPTTFEVEVSYRTHAIGFIVGLLFALIWFYFNFDYVRSFEVAVPIEPDEPDDTDAAADVMSH